MITNRNHFAQCLIATAVWVITTLLVTACKGGANTSDNSNTDSIAVVGDETMTLLAEALPKYSAVYNFQEGRALVCDKQTDLWGFIDLSGQEVIPCQYEYDDAMFHDGAAIVRPEPYTVISIDRQGNKLFDIPYYYQGDGFHDGRITVIKTAESDSGEFPMAGNMVVFGYLGIIDTAGKVIVHPDTYIVPLGEGPVITDFSDGLCRTWKDGHLCYLDPDGREVDATRFAGGGDFSDGLAWVWNEDYRTGYIDHKAQLVIPCQYDQGGQFSEDRAFVARDGHLALIDRDGRQLTPFHFDCITLYEDTEAEDMLIGSFSEGLAWCAQDGKFGYIDRQGKVVIPFRYAPGSDEEAEWYDQQPAFDFHQGYARVWDKSSGKYGYIDRTGGEFFPCIFDSAEDFSAEGIALVTVNDQYAFINTQGQCTLDLKNNLP